ncbi:MAG TPA: hypothetical protein VIK52_10200 [Opitutaceae bacterium]
MKAGAAALLIVLLVGGIVLGYYATKEQAETVAQTEAEAKKKRTLRGSGTQFISFESLDHKEQGETAFDRSVLYLADAAPAPLVNRVYQGGYRPVNSPTVLVVKDEEKQWSGVVLVPTEAVVSRAYTALVEIPRIEAHPQLDKRMRVWARVVNPTAEVLRVGVTCSFRSAGELDPYSRGFEPMLLPPGRYRDVAFISPVANVESYTILIKRY